MAPPAGRPRAPAAPSGKRSPTRSRATRSWSARNALLTVSGVASIGNQDQGVRASAAATIRKSSFFGNGKSCFANNCGVGTQAMVTVDASGDFWGAATGPGPDPADDICESLGGTVTPANPPTLVGSASTNVSAPVAASREKTVTASSGLVLAT